MYHLAQVGEERVVILAGQRLLVAPAETTHIRLLMHQIGYRFKSERRRFAKIGQRGRFRAPNEPGVDGS